MEIEIVQEQEKQQQQQIKTEVVEEEEQKAKEEGRIYDLLYPAAQEMVVGDVEVDKNGLCPPCIRIPEEDEEEEEPPRAKKTRVRRNYDYLMPCLLCSKMYSSKTYLQRHMSSKHRICMPVKQMICDFCGATFADLQSFEEHKNMAEKELNEHFGDVLEIQRQQQNLSTSLQNHVRKPFREMVDVGAETTRKVLLSLNNAADQIVESEVASAAAAAASATVITNAAIPDTVTTATQHDEAESENSSSAEDGEEEEDDTEVEGEGEEEEEDEEADE